jgi:hypothetical protein
MDKKQYSPEYEELRRRLAQTGYICTGTVATVYRKCGKSYCACATDPNARHGPYHSWTRKVKGKTVTRNLTEAQADSCSRYIANYRELEQLLEEMKSMTAEHVQGLKAASDHN